MSATEGLPLAYVDTSGLAKLILIEPETGALTEYLAGMLLTSSAIVTTELTRAVMRFDESRLGDTIELLEPILLIEPSVAILQSAGRLLPPALRSLDAIHVASALTLGSALTVFVTYDSRMREAAEFAGLRVESPGAQAAAPATPSAGPATPSAGPAQPPIARPIPGPSAPS
jgi:uncharacterized protein